MAATWKKLAFEDDVILKSIITAKGDIIGASDNATPARLGVGTDDEVLTCDANAANGLGIDWIAPSVGSHTLNDHDAADGAVDFGGQQAHDVTLDTYDTAAGLPNVNQIGMIAWATNTLHPYVLTAYSA